MVLFVHASCRTCVSGGAGKSDTVEVSCNGFKVTHWISRVRRLRESEAINLPVMPPLRIQPISSDPRLLRDAFRADSAKPVPKSRLKRLFDRPFPSVLKISSATEKPTASDTHSSRDGEFEPSSVCLANMVQNFIEENNEKQSVKCVRNRCNCFNGNGNESSDDEFDGFGESASTGSPGDACDSLKVRMCY